MNKNERCKILIVDDEKLNVMALTQILGEQHDIIVAEDGISAIVAAKQNLPDIILLDILMPGMSGFDVLRILKGMGETQYIPVMFITGLDKAEDEEKGLLLGAVDYIVKPFNKSIVKARVATHLKIARYVRTIERLCMLDALTELPNRRGFDSRMYAEWGRAIREKTPISILMIDVDKFKVYNDTYGHTQGDYLLQSIAEIFRQSLNRSTDLIARWGGEEFIALLSNTTKEGALQVAEKIRINIEKSIIPCANGDDTSVTVSIGVASIIPGINDSIVSFISLADKALYNAKNSGRNRVCSS